MNKKMFLFLLGIRAELQKEADIWIDFGIDINSKRTEALWKIREQIVKQCEKELKLPVSEYQYTTLSWALEHLDEGETFDWTKNGVKHSGKNFEDLWNLIQEEKNEMRCRECVHYSDDFGGCVKMHSFKPGCKFKRRKKNEP